jgi:hypothetical protein
MAFVSGYSVSATAIGEPDMGLLTQTEMIDRARRICLSVPIPVIVDADTGDGNPLNVHRTVAGLIAAGAAGCFLEDQVWPKRCGHMRGKRVIGGDDYVQKVRMRDTDYTSPKTRDLHSVLATFCRCRGWLYRPDPVRENDGGDPTVRGGRPERCAPDNNSVSREKPRPMAKPNDQDSGDAGLVFAAFNAHHERCGAPPRLRNTDSPGCITATSRTATANSSSSPSTGRRDRHGLGRRPRLG